MKKLNLIVTKFISYVGIALMVIPIGILAYAFIFPEGSIEAKDFNTEKENAILTKPIFAVEDKPKFKDPFLGIDNSALNETALQVNVPTNSVATTGAIIRIPSIGVDTTIYESYNAELALESGVWRDPAHGAPDRYDKPIVLGAHRWGAESLSWEYRYKNLFNKFDVIQPGEIVEIVWNNKTYKFRIRAVEQNYVVTQTADLIMYTCVYYGSPERYIVYAERI